ncbi:MAG: Nramp family divalent metal transporter [Chloroflexota bacterium]
MPSLVPRRVSLRRFIGQAAKFLGPAFVVSVAYIDPGNFATNITGGSLFGYDLLWVILASNLMAIFLQTLSAKLGIATGRTLPDVCGDLFSRRVNRWFWSVAVLAAAATVLAEMLGGALGLYLLFGLPVPLAGIVTALLTLLICSLGRFGQEKVEWVITGLVAVISFSYVIELFLAGPDWGRVALHTVVPQLNGESAMLAVGMLGATVMPHVIYLHSGLVLSRRDSHSQERRRQHYAMEKIDVAVAMNIAFVINAAMVVVAAAVFNARGMGITSITEAHMSLRPLLGSLSSGAFAIALLASGLSSSTVGAIAGDCILDGFRGPRLPRWAQRVITMGPALAIICLNLEPIKVLVLSQVSLSFALPLAIIPLLLITSRREVMGSFVNSRLTGIAGWLIAGLIIALNAYLVVSLIF